MKECFRVFTSVWSQTKLPKTSDSFSIYRLKWLFKILDGYSMKASECFEFELLINALDSIFGTKIALIVELLPIFVTAPYCFWTVTVDVFNCRDVISMYQIHVPFVKLVLLEILLVHTWHFVHKSRIVSVN